MLLRISLTGILIFTTNILFAQKIVVYKKVDTTELRMSIYEPPDFNKNKKYTAMVFFFGGGWRVGNASQFQSQATYFASKGLVCFLPEYRVESRNQSTPFESLKDAKSAIRFIKKNADRFHIDSSKIVAAGGSAGGQLAAATALIKDYNENTDNLQISSVPAALVLFNPVIDNGPGGFGYEKIGDEYLHFSPLHNIRKVAPPTLIMLGKKDHLIPVVTAEYYKMVMEKVGSKCELKLYDNAGHGFFNQNKKGNNRFYFQTLAATEEFLHSIGYLLNK